MSTNLLSQHHATDVDHPRATLKTPVELVQAFAQMATGISRKQVPEHKWRFDDASRNRPVRPLGVFPEVADAVIEAGGSYHYVARPLAVMMAHLRRRCSAKLPQDMKAAQINLKKQCDEAEAEGLNISLTVTAPAVSDLIAFTKEADEAIVALETAKELVEDRLSEMGAL